MSMMSGTVVVFLISWALAIGVSVLVGDRKDRMTECVLLAVFLGWLGVLLAAFLSPSHAEQVRRAAERQEVEAEAAAFRAEGPPPAAPPHSRTPSAGSCTPDNHSRTGRPLA